MAKYRNKGGPHQTRDGTNIAAGAVFESDDPLDAFADKFERVIDAPPEPEAPKPEPKPEPEAPKPEAPKPEPDPDPEDPETDPGAEGSDGDDPNLKDVTADFPTAGENDMRVLKGKRGWHILDEGDAKPINPKPLLKREVDGAIADYLAD